MMKKLKNINRICKTESIIANVSCKDQCAEFVSSTSVNAQKEPVLQKMYYSAI